MKLFSIKQLEQFSGVKQHTIRIWERRYGLLHPLRNISNVRMYSIEDVNRLMNVSLLSEYGFRISQIAQLQQAEMDDCLMNLKTAAAQYRKAVNRLIVAMFLADIDSFEEVLDSCVVMLGIDTTIQQVIIPFLERAEVVSFNDSGYETHFVVTAVRKKIIFGIEKLPAIADAPKTVLLYLPKGEHYDLLLLYMTYIVKKKGLKTFYLGTDISEENLGIVISSKKPDLIYTYLQGRHMSRLKEHIRVVTTEAPGTTLYVAGAGLSLPLITQENVSFFYFREIETVLSNCI